ncbi:MAG: Uma2 family endonuclease [Bacteroidetes bacterium]|nr:Uma2 family endonuclease [Fibrella sp.]
MTHLVLPIDIEPGVNLLDRIRTMTDDEFYFFCQENGALKFERDTTGIIKIRTQTGGETGERTSELIIDLGNWNRQSKLGYVYDSSTGFRLPNGATRSPDAAWVLADRRNALTPEQRKKFPPLCPDFVVELMSESDALKDALDKMQEYMDNGCRLAWLINPKTEETRIYRPDGSVRVLTGFDNTLTGEDVLPGFAFELAVLR